MAPPATSSGERPVPDSPAASGRSSSARKGGLGRGLSALIPMLPATEAAAPTEVAIDAIAPNPFQPRANLDADKLDELTQSIRRHGVIQPLIVTRGEEADRYVLIAGERRWRAAVLAGLTAVPVVIKEAAPQAMLELALVENVVRADLSPLEEAGAYRQLIEEFGLTQASVAERVGRSRVSVTNTLRLLGAPARIQAALNTGEISEGHARALLGLPTAADQLAAFDAVVERGLTVRQTEELVRRHVAGSPTSTTNDRRRPADETRLEDRFRTALGTKVSFKRGRHGAGGSLTIHYGSDEELDALYQRLVGEETW